MVLREFIFSTLVLNCVIFVRSDVTFYEECLNYTVYPVQYELTVTPHLYENNFYYDCDITITVISAVPGVNVVELNARDLEIDQKSVGVWFDSKNIIDVNRPIFVDHNNGKLYIYLKESLKPYRGPDAGTGNNQYYIKMSFRGYMNRHNSGFFVIPYREDSTVKWLLSTRLSPNYASTVYPCFENPQFEAGFKFKFFLSPEVTRRNMMTNLVIAPEMRRHIDGNNYTIVDFYTSPQIPAREVGFHISDFTSRQNTAKLTNDTFVVWTKPSSIKYSSYILELGTKLIDIFPKYLSTNRPITMGNINLVALPTFEHGFEINNWNLLVAGEQKVLFVEQLTSSRQTEQQTLDLALQLSRVWLGNPGESTRTRWKEWWFKEGMATYFAHYFLSQMDKSFPNMNYYGMKMKHRAMMMDWNSDTRALASYNMTDPLDTSAEEQEMIATKTASILWMIENWLGSDVFHSIVKKFINERRGKFVTVQDFGEYLQEKAVLCEFFKGYTISEVINTWILQPGYPVINVDVYRDQNVISITQEHMTPNFQTKRDYKYLIPISYIAQNTENCFNCFQPRFIIGGSDYSLKENLNGGWIIVNRNGAGYYRVNYDAESWKLITLALKGTGRGQISDNNRAQIMNDAFALYAAGLMELNIATEVVSCLEFEEEPVVWEAAISGFQVLKTKGAAVGMSKQLFDFWKRFMREQVSRVYGKVSKSFDRDHKTRVFKSIVINFACSIDHVICLRDLQRDINRVKAHQTYDPDLREICYFVMLKQPDGWELINHTMINEFEKEEEILAKENLKQETWFTRQLPYARPEPIVMISTERPVCSENCEVHPPLQVTAPSSAVAPVRWNTVAFLALPLFAAYY